MPKDKLPEVGTTIFTIMSAYAKKYNALNLGQGFPDFPADSLLKNLVAKRIDEDYNQYPPMPGIEELRKLLQAESQHLYNAHYDAETEITITSGATEALFNAISSLVFPGDEVIIFEPAYDSYVPVIKLNEGKVVPVPLMPPGFDVPFDKIRQAISEKTRLIIINTPHNPIGKVWTQAEIEQLWEMIKDKDIFLISDEVYEHITFAGHKHFSIRQHEGLRKRSFVIGSFGKSFHVTGWKVGYAMAPAELTKLFRKIHQFNTFSTSTPFQYAIADYMKLKPKYYKDVKELYQKKRDLIIENLKGSKFQVIEPAGTYFMLLDYSNVSDMNDVDFAKFLTEKYKITMIPISVFYTQKYSGKVLRICFAKRDKVLVEAGKILSSISV